MNIIDYFNLISPKRLKESSFTKNVLTVVSGAVFAQAIGLLFSPIITRLYGPEAFGILGIFVAFVTILSPLVAFSLPMAIVLPKKTSEAIKLSVFSIFLSICLSVFIFLFIVINKNWLIVFLNIEAIESFILFIPIYLILYTIFQVTDYGLIRANQYLTKSKSLIGQSFIVNGFKVGFGYFYPFASVLIILTTFGQVVYLIFSYRLTNIKSLYKYFNKDLLDLYSYIQILKKYLDFPKYRAPQMFIDGVTRNLPTIILAIYFGPISAGYFALSNRVLSVPGQVIGQAIGDVFYPKVTKTAHEKGLVMPLVLKSTFILFIVGLIPFGTLILFGPLIFNFIFGDQWVSAGSYSQWLALWLFSTFLNKTAIKTLPVIGELKYHLLYTNVTLILRTLGLLIGSIIFGNDLIAIALFSVFGAISNIYLLIVIFKKCRKYDSV